MKKKTFIIGASALALVVVVVIGVVVGSGFFRLKRTGLTYPDYPLANAESESWTQWRDYDDTTAEVSWWVNYSSFAWAGNDSSIVSDIIYEKTGVKIKFQSPLNDDGTQLNNLIAGNELPDIITVLGSGKERIELAEDGYVYPVNELAKRWAPRLLDRISPDISDYFNGSDGLLYGLPSNFYTSKDMDAYEEQGHKLLSNGAIVARRDYLEAYVAYKKSVDPRWSDVEATTPDGFIEMCKWVKQHYGIDNSSPTVLLSPFESTNTALGNQGIQWLMEYFNVKPEDDQGRLTYMFDDPKFKEAMLFLNRCYSENLILSGNFTTSSTQIGSYIQNGLPFVCIMSPQNYNSQFKNWTKDHEQAEYIPIVLTNAAGEAPQLRSFAGNGYRFTMVTSNCKRPDRVIKLLDYLWSDEGRTLLYYGVEGVTFEYEQGFRPGENTLYPYGRMVWTQDMRAAFNTNKHGQYGALGNFNLLTNPMLPYMTQEKGFAFNNYPSYIMYNLKASLEPFVYNHQNLEYPYDTSDKEKYVEMIKLRSKLYKLWADSIPTIVLSKNAETAAAEWESTVSYAKLWGCDELTAWQDSAFQTFKQRKGIQWGYPANDPDSGYTNLRVTSVFGKKENLLAAPADIPRI